MWKIPNSKGLESYKVLNSTLLLKVLVSLTSEPPHQTDNKEEDQNEKGLEGKLFSSPRHK